MVYSTSTSTIWLNWNQTITISATNSTTGVWSLWVENTGSTATTAGTTAAVWPIWVGTPTPEARAEQARREEAWRRQAAEERRKTELAEERALRLLRSCLSDEQNRNLRDLGFFFVQAISGRRYRIEKGSHGNVKVVDAAGQWVESLCVQPNAVPAGDAMLMQKLLIETAEDVFRETANITVKNGSFIRGSGKLLDNKQLEARVLPFRRAA